MKFIKEIARPCKVKATALDGKTRVDVTLTADRLRKSAQTGTEMLASGLKIYAPWKHGFSDKDGPLGPNRTPKDNPQNETAGSNENAGFWEKIWYDDAVDALYAQIDAPREEDSDKIGTTVKEVSPLFRTFVDGQGRKWEDAPYHIALVTHPIISGQENFKPVEMAASLCGDDGFAFSMSDIQELLLTEKAPIDQTGNHQEEIALAASEEKIEKKEEIAETPVAGASVADALKVLKRSKIELPADTTAENFIERLVIALNAIEKATAPETDGKPPIEQPMPVAMSLEGDPIVAEKIETPNPLQVFAENQARSGYVSRIEALVKTGRTPPAYALKHLKPLVEGFALSLGDDGEPQKGLLDQLLEALEAIPENTILNVSGSAKTGKNKKGVAFSFEEPLPEGYEGDPDGKPDDARAVAEADAQVAKMEGREAKTSA